MIARFKLKDLYVLHGFLYERRQASVPVGTREVFVGGSVWSEFADHQVKVIPPQPSQLQGLVDRADLRETHPSLLKFCYFLFQPGEKKTQLHMKQPTQKDFSSSLLICRGNTAVPLWRDLLDHHGLVGDGSFVFDAGVGEI